MRSTVIILLTLLMSASIGIAHPAMYVAANLKIERDGRFRVHARFDVLAFALNDTPADVDHESMSDLLDGPRERLEAALSDARERLLRGVTIRCDDGAIVRATSVRFPTVEDVYRSRDANVLPRLPLILEATLDGLLPHGARVIAVKFPEALGALVLTVERPGEEAYAEPLAAGRYGSTLPLAISVASPSPPPSTSGAAARYFSIGFSHIVPHGLDHVLFVIGLFLLSPKLKPLLAQVTAFTVAHSITLGMSLYNVARLPANIVEPLIALSIAFIAIENLCTTRLKPWRPIVVFAFGLVHGLGFAGVLQQFGLPRSQFAMALVSFNGGVELGQLTVLSVAFALVGLFRQRTWYRGVIAMPASFAIATVALIWTIQRVYQ